MSFADGEDANAARMQRLASSIPAAYTFIKTGSTYYAETTIKGGTDYNGTVFTDVWDDVLAALGTAGGKIFFKQGTYTQTAIACVAPGASNSIGTLILQGEGMYNTIWKADNTANTWASNNGMLGYYGGLGAYYDVPQVICLDMAFDGNYSGVDAGQNSVPAANPPALISLPQAHDDAGNPTVPRLKAPHIFERCRFYRPSGFGFQPLTVGVIRNCVFDQCGQPDQAVDNWDNIGGGDWQNLLVEGNTWYNSRGNYIDIAAETNGRPSTVIFKNNQSYGQVLGGVYALGYKSIIANNLLNNDGAGSSISYDATTHANNRLSNIVRDNTLANVTVGWDSTKGDYAFNNIGNPSENWVTGSGVTGFTIAHGLAANALTASSVPTVVVATPVEAAAIKFSITADATNITVIHDKGAAASFTAYVKIK